jgi:hypothetical protein
MTDSYFTTEKSRILKANVQMHSRASCVTIPLYAVTPPIAALSMRASQEHYMIGGKLTACGVAKRGSCLVGTLTLSDRSTVTSVGNPTYSHAPTPTQPSVL